MAGPRVVRIPRGPPVSPAPLEETPSSPVGPERSDLRPNVGGSQRAVRLALLYLFALALVYLIFVVSARSTAGGTSPGGQDALLLFTAGAVLFGVAGAVLALHPAPRSIEATPSRYVVRGRWGGRTVWPRSSELTVRVVRRFPPRGLSAVGVELVELSAPGRSPRSYLVEAGLLAGEGAP